MAAIVVALIGLVVLVINELWWRHYKDPGELSRKFVHLSVGCFVATWPYFLSWNEIRWLALVALVVVLISKYFNLFQTIHTVTRPTWGEAYFALAVGLTTLITYNKAVFTVAILQMGLADSFAAVVGMKYGLGNDYKVFGASKSLAGSGAFLVVSYVILLSFSQSSLPISIPWCLGLATAAAGLENIAIRGLDNLVVPLFVAYALRLLT